MPQRRKGRGKKSLSELLHYSSSLSERPCFDCSASVPPNKPNTSAPQVVTENMLTVAIELNKLTKLCKQHTLRAFISKHAVPRFHVSIIHQATRKRYAVLLHTQSNFTLHGSISKPLKCSKSMALHLQEIGEHISSLVTFSAIFLFSKWKDIYQWKYTIMCVDQSLQIVLWQ